MNSIPNNYLNTSLLSLQAQLASLPENDSDKQELSRLVTECLAAANITDDQFTLLKKLTDKVTSQNKTELTATICAIAAERLFHTSDTTSHTDSTSLFNRDELSILKILNKNLFRWEDIRHDTFTTGSIRDSKKSIKIFLSVLAKLSPERQKSILLNINTRELIPSVTHMVLEECPELFPTLLEIIQ